mmetsp:Transcript_42255/g.67919  ORF Transcript_42255/g.67919 Transcript_42255/m.67919 type:complete len:234 (-) Transcript_42255:639-1340(-)
MRRGPSLAPEVPLDVQKISYGVIIQAVQAELLALGAHLLQRPRQRLAHRHGRGLLWPAPKGGLVVGNDRLHDERFALTARHRGRDGALLANEIHHLRAAPVAHGDILRVPRHVRMVIGNAHVPHHQVGQAVDVVEATVARRRDDVLELVGGQAEIRHLLRVPVSVLEMDLIVLHELVVHHRLGLGAGFVQKLLQSLLAPVVRAVGAHDVQGIQAQVRLHAAQRLHRASHADEQ